MVLYPYWEVSQMSTGNVSDILDKLSPEELELFEMMEEKIPEGCRACGGDYPNCKDSCKLFDD